MAAPFPTLVWVSVFRGSVQPIKSTVAALGAIRAWGSQDAAALVVTSIKGCQEAAQKENQFPVLGEEEVAGNLRKLLSVLAFFLHGLIPGCSHVEGQAARKSRQPGRGHGGQ